MAQSALPKLIQEKDQNVVKLTDDYRRNVSRIFEREGELLDLLTSAPVKMPALPNPTIVRPMMRALQFGATPQTRLLISNREMAARNS